ncbi:MAG: histidinol-phosphatase [Clostridia bacterium]|nr:histidinol-phosphatase [Clostridia bacterium]
MLYNYHTHTARCNHASLTPEREYVEKAIEAGIKTLGFSDHAPYLFPDTDFQSFFRMKQDEIELYADTVRSLAKEYEKDIRILCGFELEYYPDYHKEEIQFLQSVKPDYLILGQHFLGNELNNQPVHNRLKTDGELSAYVTQVLAGLTTGDFLYLAHPDIAGANYSPEAVEREYTRLCKGAKRMGIPLELNFLGLRTNRCYPNEAFLKIAAKVGNEIVFGLDSHEPESVNDPTTLQKAHELVDKFGLKLIEKPFF